MSVDGSNGDVPMLFWLLFGAFALGVLAGFFVAGSQEQKSLLYLNDSLKASGFSAFPAERTARYRWIREHCVPLDPPNPFSKPEKQEKTN